MCSKFAAAIAAFFVFTALQPLDAQNISWNSLGTSFPSKQHLEKSIEVSKGQYYEVDALPEANALSDGTVIEIPLSGGILVQFELNANSTLHPDLQDRFPEIRSFDALATDGSGYRGKVDISPQGFHAMLYRPGQSNMVFVDPVYRDHNSIYVAYQKENFQTDKVFECAVEGGNKYELPDEAKADYNSCELRTYRIAISTTGEYAQFHGGTVVETLSAINTTMNRVNGLYERDFGVTMELIPNTDEVIYTNPSTDPYSNGDTFAMINQVQSVINSVIGSSNYDIGHVFGTDSGGLAGLGVTCTNSAKARGVTGSGFPVGDPFDVDYVAHEIGHQFGATHTFNNFCFGNRTDATAVEPGSGSTIMAYAGICPPNVQNNSDDHFHGVSMRQIGLEITSDNCPVVSSLDNLAPVIDSLTSDVVVPAETPFAITVHATDPDPDDVLTYNCEQIDNEISPQPPVATAQGGPNFRSFSPTVNPTQYFPRLQDLSSFGEETWQVLSSVDRTMSFRCTVRDNAQGGGCTEYEDTEITITAAAGPFAVTQPTLPGVTWAAFSQETVTWDVANTDLAPVNCETVDIFLSIDGGETFPEQLADDVPNSGSAVVEVPNTATEDARIMVMNSQGTFFDISNNDFTIDGIENGYIITAENETQSVCIGENLNFTIGIEAFGNFDEDVNLSLDGDLGDVDATLAAGTLAVGESTTLNIENTSQIDPGVLDVIVLGSAPSFEQSLTLEAGFNATETETPTPVFPENEAEFVSTSLLLDWDAQPSPDAIYTVQISDDPTFSSNVIELESLVSTQLNVDGLMSSTTYYWRVDKSTPCAQSDFSETFSFLTHSCFGFVAEDVPVTISSIPGETTSFLEVPYEGTIEDVNITSITGSHGVVADLSMTLVSPSGTEVELFNSICEGDQDFNLGFDDASDLTVVDCPPTNGNVYRPLGNLSDLIGEPTQGTWSLVINDPEIGGGGELSFWSIEVCVASAGTFVLSSDVQELFLCQGESTTIEVSAQEVFSFEDPITLTDTDTPGGVSVTFEPAAIEAGQTSDVTLEVESDAAPGLYSLSIVGASGNVTDEFELSTGINLSQPQTPDLISPAAGAETTGFAIFEWQDVISPNAVYDLEIAFDQDFTDPFDSFNSLGTNMYSLDNLPPSETFFWRVHVDNGCATSTSEVRSFSTQACGVYQAGEDLPINISPIPDEYAAPLEIELSGEIESIRVPVIVGTHFSVDDLTMSLESPSGTEVLLFSNICTGEQDFDLGFIENGMATINCPPTDGLFYAPSESFAAFEGEDPEGTWILRVVDDQAGGGGQLVSWGLEICYTENVFSTDDFVNANFNLFPNPSTGQISIVVDEVTLIDEVRILDIGGRLIRAENDLSGSSVSLDLSDLRNGVYLVQISGEFGRMTRKIILQK